jgi:hypothetical protein
MECLQMHQPGGERRRIARLFGLPDQRHPGRARHDVGQGPAQRPFPLFRAGQAQLRPGGIVEHPGALGPGQMGGADPQQDDALQVAGMGGGQVGEAHGAGDGPVQEGGLLQVREQPAPPVRHPVARRVAGAFRRQAFQQHPQLASHRIGAQGVGGGDRLQGIQQARVHSRRDWRPRLKPPFRPARCA